jgi:hypothetical protein
MVGSALWGIRSNVLVRQAQLQCPALLKSKDKAGRQFQEV